MCWVVWWLPRPAGRSSLVRIVKEVAVSTFRRECREDVMFCLLRGGYKCTEVNNIRTLGRGVGTVFPIVSVRSKSCLAFQFGSGCQEVCGAEERDFMVCTLQDWLKGFWWRLKLRSRILFFLRKEKNIGRYTPTQKLKIGCLCVFSHPSLQCG